MKNKCQPWIPIKHSCTVQIKEIATKIFNNDITKIFHEEELFARIKKSMKLVIK